MEHRELTQIDKAFLNSMLSYGVYKANRWLQPHSIQQIPEQPTFRKSYERTLKQFNAKVFIPIMLDLPGSGDIKSKFYETKFTSQLGYYTAWDDLAGAVVFESMVNNKKALHIAFRGTDINSTKLKDFVSYAYFDMPDFYKCFKPFEDAVWKYVKENNIQDVQVSGHSLGGAMVQEFFNSPEAKKTSVNLSGFTYGSPNSTKSLIHHTICRIGHNLANKSFMEMVKTSASIFRGGNEIYSKQEIDKRICQYKHDEDIVPQAGLIFYKYSDHISLKDSCHDLEEGFTVFKNMMNNHKKLFWNNIDKKVKTILKYHDMLRYTINLERLGQEMLDKGNQIYESMPYISIFNEVKISNLEKKKSNISK